MSAAGRESPGGPRAGGSRQTPEYVEGSGGRLSLRLLENGRPLIKGTYPRTARKMSHAIGDTVAREIRLRSCGSVRRAAYLVEMTWRDADTGRCGFRSLPNGMYVVLPVVPTCIYTEPEIAAVGFTENDARLYNMKIKCGVAYMTENGKALLARNSRGFVRLIFEAYTNR
ncbi:MAG: hypothetical protein ACLT76_01515 [Clostridium fessum]